MNNAKIALILAAVVFFGLLIYKNVNNDVRANGEITGRVSIGPLCPIEPCPGSPANPYISRSLVLKPSFGQSVYLKLADDGSFSASIPAGAYSASITDCQFLGCQYALPKSVKINRGETSELLIEIDTGIR